GPELLPKDSPVRVFFSSLARDFPYASGPEVSVAAQGSLDEVTRWAEGSVATLPGVLSARTEQRSPQIVAVSVYVDGAAQDQASRDVVASIRENRPAFQTWVAGPAARLADFTASTASRAPFAGAVVALGTLALLFLLTGSLVIPLKALVLNLLSLGASLGILVWVFQQGHLEWALGFSSNGAIESFIPLLVLAFGFGLSMDYEVFLISRIAEIYHGGGTTDDAVWHGLQRSGRIITSAALLIVIVFAGFIAGQLIVIKQTGLALTTAILLDASLVRMLLVPATMTLLGEWSWWSPAPLRRWHAKYGIIE
ncbi:MAG TPA: MMPL family transporter, partial [Candidatus Lustribacter sp.]|nr:MMPL family transporter [Candidatus Lustribacter sp.]